MWTFAEVNATRIDPQEILYFVTEMGRKHKAGEYTDFEAGVFLLFKRYEGTPDRSEKVFCIMERMRCFSRVTSDEQMRGWTMETRDQDCMLTNEAIFRATAFCPIGEQNGHTYFDADEFFALALNETEAEGRA